MRFKKANFPQKFVKMLVNPTGLTALLPFLAKNLHFLNSTTRFAVTKIKDFDSYRMGVVTQIRDLDNTPTTYVAFRQPTRGRIIYVPYKNNAYALIIYTKK